MRRAEGPPVRTRTLTLLAAAALAATAAGCGQSTRVLGSPETCGTCHGAPPPAPHPALAADVRYCWACHPGTVDPAGRIIPGGLHQDGQVEFTMGGHPAGFSSPAVHGREFFAFVSDTGGLPCLACHGSGYDVPLAGGRSCNTCHEVAGWTNWLGNCSFCHGLEDTTTRAGYAVSDHPAWAAPPDAISQRLGGGPAPERTGAHAIHLSGSALAGAFPCATCHEVPTTLAHVSGRDARAAVAPRAPWQAAPDAAGYDPATGTCATACHGTGRSPAWSTTGIACDGCHGVPPATAAHAGVSGSDLTVCAGCHPATITAAGAIDVAGGKHVNGTVDRVGGHAAGFAQPSSHGPAYLAYVAGAPGAADCRTCHGATLPQCTGCHATAASGGWASWETNCTFCHGTRTPAYDPALLGSAAPPDAVAERLSGTPAPSRTGKHRAHLKGRSGYPAFACGTCHAVPASVSHVRVDLRAPVVFDAAAAFPALSPVERAALPAPLAVYDASASPPTCASNYCHGATLTGGSTAPPRWSSAAASINSCGVCHGAPPDTGAPLAADGQFCSTPCSNHVFHVQALTSGCDACHHGGAPVNGAGLHVNGRVDVAWPPGTTGTWDGGARTCASMSCHSDAGARSW